MEMKVLSKVDMPIWKIAVTGRPSRDAERRLPCGVMIVTLSPEAEMLGELGPDPDPRPPIELLSEPSSPRGPRRPQAREAAPTPRTSTQRSRTGWSRADPRPSGSASVTPGDLAHRAPGHGVAVGKRVSIPCRKAVS